MIDKIFKGSLFTFIGFVLGMTIVGSYYNKQIEEYKSLGEKYNVCIGTKDTITQELERCQQTNKGLLNLNNELNYAINQAE